MFRRNPEAIAAKHARKDARLVSFAFDMHKVGPSRVVTRHGFRENAVTRMPDKPADEVRYAANVAFLGMVASAYEDRFTSESKLVLIDPNRHFNDDKLRSMTLEYALRPRAIAEMNLDLLQAGLARAETHELIVPVAHALRAAIAIR